MLTRITAIITLSLAAHYYLEAQRHFPVGVRHFPETLGPNVEMKGTMNPATI